MADNASPVVDKVELARNVLSLNTPEEIKTALEGHDDLKKELFEDPEAFVKKYSVAEEKTETNKKDEAEVKTEEVAATDDELVEIKLPKKFLGTYKDGEALFKGMIHKDEVISTLKERLSEVSANGEREVTSLRKLLEEHQQKKDTTPSPAQNKTEEVVSVDDFDLGDSIDLLDEEAQKKLLDAFKTIIANNKNLSEELNSVKGSVNKVSSVVESGLELTQRKEREIAENAAFLRIKKSSGIFESDRPIETIKSEYAEFLINGSRLLGYDGTIMDAAGNFTEGAIKAFNTYFDEANGADFRAKLQAANVEFPEDYADIKKHAELAELRSRRLEYDPISKTNKPIPWEEAVALYANQTGISARRELESHKRGAETYAKAVGNRKKFATEVTPAAGAAADTAMDINQIKAMMHNLDSAVQTGKDPTQEKERLRVALINGGMEPPEVEFFLSTFKKRT